MQVTDHMIKTLNWYLLEKMYCFLYSCRFREKNGCRLKESMQKRD